MKTILCYGDSNTYGHLPLDGSRMPAPWPKVLGSLLPEFKIIEEGQCGRTTHRYETDPAQDGTVRFGELLQAGLNVDLLIIMLGTNDTLNGINCETRETVESLRAYIKSWRNTYGENSKILLISPIHITDAFKRHEVFSVVYPTDAPARSETFSPAYEKLAKEENVYFLDAAQYAETSDKDGIHMEPEAHKKLALAIAKKIVTIFD